MTNNELFTEALLSKKIHEGLLSCALNWRLRKVPANSIADGLLSAGVSVAVTALGPERTADWLRSIATEVQKGAEARTIN